MAKHIIVTDQAPTSALYSQGVKVGRTIYVAGMAGIDPRTKEMAGPSIQAQTHQAISNCQAVLEAAGGRVLALPEERPLGYSKAERGYDNPHFIAWGQ